MCLHSYTDLNLNLNYEYTLNYECIKIRIKTQYVKCTENGYRELCNILSTCVKRVFKCGLLMFTSRNMDDYGSTTTFRAKHETVSMECRPKHIRLL